MSEFVPSSKSIADAAVVPAHDPVPMRFDEPDEVLHRLQPAAFRAVAPAPQIPGGLGAVALVFQLADPRPGPAAIPWKPSKIRLP